MLIDVRVAGELAMERETASVVAILGDRHADAVLVGAPDEDPVGADVALGEPDMERVDGVGLTRPRRGVEDAHFRGVSRDAGVPGRLFHDFRRSAVRNLERAGESRSVAMKITGHKTESVYRRYAIVSDADLREATRKLMGTIAGTTTAPPLDSPRASQQNP